MKKRTMLLIVILILLLIALLSRKIIMYNNDYYIQQNEIEKALKKDYNSASRTMEEPFIKVNPYNTNELSAYIAFDSSVPYSYEYTVKGKTADTSFTYKNDSKTKQIIIPIVGLYQNENNLVSIEFFSEDNKSKKMSYNLRTEAIEGSTTVDIKNKNTYDKLMNDSVIVDNYNNLYDKNGDIRLSGVLQNSWYGYAKLYDGHILISSKKSLNKEFNSIYNVNLMGRINPDFKMQAPKGYEFHHDMTFGNEKLYALISDDSHILESEIGVFDKHGNFEDIIDIAPYFPEDEMPENNADENSLHLNSIDFLKSENQLVLSSRNFGKVLSYDLDDATISWMLDQPEGIAKENQKYMLNPTSESIHYTSGQHTAAVVSEEQLPQTVKYDSNMRYISVFDNQSCVSKNGPNPIKVQNSEEIKNICINKEARGIIYELNLKEKTFTQVYEINSEYKSPYKGSYNLGENYQELFVAMAGQYQLFDTKGNLIANMYMPLVKQDTLDENGFFSYRAKKVTVSKLKRLIEKF